MSCGVPRGVRVIRQCAAVLAAVFCTAAVARAQQVPASPYLRVNPERILIADNSSGKPCGECHQSEVTVWKGTKHSSGFDAMHKKESAVSILDAMGYRLAKRQEAVCMRCHYTVGASGTAAVAGVSCESCHGAARDWIDVHNKFAGGAKDSRDETPANRAARLGAARAAGMLSPSTDIYGVAANCFDCHTIPMEKLVNDGGHKAGNKSFDLVAGIGKIRHNFIGSGTSGTNRAITPERRRELFVVGRWLAYEYALRAAAQATKDGAYSEQVVTNASAALKRLQEVNSAVRNPAIDEVLATGRKAKLTTGNGAEILAAANQIRAIGQRYASTLNGATLAALDPVITGEPAAAPAAAAAAATPTPTAPTPAAAAAPARGGAAAPPAPATSGGAAATSGAAGTSPQVPPRSAVAPTAVTAIGGSIKSRPDWIVVAGRTGYAEAGECASCHRDAAKAWKQSKHMDTGERRLLGEDSKARKIATAYGVGADGMQRPNAICASCHRTVDEGKRSAAALEDGVSCESCHGAGGKFLEPHQDGGNPQAGMRNLKQAAERAQVCAGCHRITDERLLAAGHSSGADYDIAASMEKIKHWPDGKVHGKRTKAGGTYPAVEAGALRAAFATVASARPIPKVTVVAAPSPAAPTPVAPTPAPSGGAVAPSPAVNAPTPDPASGGSSSQVPLRPDVSGSTARPVVPRSSRPLIAPTAPPRSHAQSIAPVSLDLEPLPSTEKMSVSELLLLIKQRVDKVHAATRRN
jgi:hypothetical protein